MDSEQQTSVGDYPWQATVPGILRNIKDEFELANATSGLSQQTVRKKLTTEALVMLSVILLFVILTLIRTAIGVYESCKGIGKKTHSSTTQKDKTGDGALRRFLDCFNIKSNAERLLNTVITEKHLCSLHGVRSIVLLWLLYGHIAMFYVVSVKTPENFKSFLDMQMNHVLKNTVFIVDAFLVLSGFLNGYLFSQHYEKRKGNISWFAFYFHRITRISPMYFIVLGFYATLFPYLGSGPVWPTYDTNPVCKENWIWNVLFLNNFISHKRMCLTPTWYLSCELQLYILSPIFLILLMRRPKIGYVLIAFIISGSCFINFLLTYHHNLVDGPSRILVHYGSDFTSRQGRFWEYFDILYTKIYSRIGTFLIGIALGCYLYRMRSIPIKESNRVKITFGWIMAAVCLWISIFALYGREESVIETAVYNGLKHVLFSIFIVWVIFVCVTGQGGFVNRFLCSKIFIVISRLSYMVVLIHMIILEGYFLSLKDLIDHSLLTTAIYILMVNWIFPVAFVMAVIFEAPILKIIAMFVGETNKERKTGKKE